MPPKNNLRNPQHPHPWFREYGRRLVNARLETETQGPRPAWMQSGNIGVSHPLLCSKESLLVKDEHPQGQEDKHSEVEETSVVEKASKTSKPSIIENSLKPVPALLTPSAFFSNPPRSIESQLLCKALPPLRDMVGSLAMHPGNLNPPLNVLRHRIALRYRRPGE